MNAHHVPLTNGKFTHTMVQSCTSIEVMCHRDNQNQRVRSKTVVFSAWQDHIILDLHVSTVIGYRCPTLWILTR